MKSWNPVLNIVMELKQEYKKRFGKTESYNRNDFKSLISELNDEKYNDFFDCLQINQYKEFILIRYGVAEMQRSMWTDCNSPYREARSVVIDLKNENLVTCGFRKFFNLNEVDETKLEIVLKDIEKASVFEVVDKLDGSMQNARWYNDDVFMTGSMALDEGESWRLQNGKSLITDEYRRMLKENSKHTFTFEYISNINPHVVDYTSEQEGLYVIGVRDVRDGYQLSNLELEKLISKYQNVKSPKVENKTLEELLQLMKTERANEKEGWVINVDGHLIKLKCDDYVNIHRLLDRVASVNVVIEAIADDSYDDLLSKVPELYRDRVEGISNKVFNYTAQANKLIHKHYNEAPKTNRKEFMIWVDKNVPKEIQSYVKNMYLEQPYNLLKKGKTGYKKMSDLEVEWVA